MTTTAPDQRLLTEPLRRADDLVHVEVDGETVVYHCSRNSLTVLDATSTAVWTRLDGRGALDVVCAELARQYAAPLAVVRADVLALVARLLDEGLVDRAG